MVIYYALGGGLGHLTRARCALAALRLDDDAMLLTASRYAHDERVTGGLPVIEVPRRLGDDRRRFAQWMDATLGDLRPDELIVDTFPGGILGELCGLELPPLRLLARRLRWPAYRRRLAGPLPRYEVAHAIEPLSAPHVEVLSTIAHRSEPLALAPAENPVGPRLHDGPHVVVVHTGPGEELGALIELAHELRPEASVPVIIVSPRRPDRLPAGTAWRDIYPVGPHLHHAELIVTGAGWGIMRDTEHVRDRHRYVPFPRPLDDQFWRAGWASQRARAGAPATL